MVLGLWIQLRVYPNHDVAWVLWGAREMMHGARYGVDIIEPNPPLAWYLSMPTTALAEWLGVPLDQPFRIGLALLGALSAGSLIWLRPARMALSEAAALAVVAAVGLIVLVGREFGQRDPITMILVLPYLALAARRLNASPLPSVAARAAIGIVAGLGFGLKPYFLAVPLLIELCLLVFGKRRQLFRAENVSAAVTLAAYGAWLFAFEQPYLRDIIPLAQEIYWSFNPPFADILAPLALQFACASAFIVLAIARRDGLGLVLSASLFGFAFAYLAQLKGYAYHLMPVRAVALLLAARFMLDRDLPRNLRLAALGLAAMLTLLWWMPFRAWWWTAKPGGALYTQIERIDDSIDRHARGGSFLVVAVRTYPSFPAGIYAPARYISRTNGQWFLPAVAQLRAVGHPSASVERHAREFIMHDLGSKPTLVLIDTDSRGHTRGPANFDFLAFYKEDPKFRGAWAAYREIEPIDHFRQFVRTNGDEAR